MHVEDVVLQLLSKGKYPRLAADFDGDGDLDVVVSVPAGLPYRYFRNDGGMMFTDRSAASGLGLSGDIFGMQAADIDNDGDQDIFVTQEFGPMQLFINNGSGQFTDEAAARGLIWSHESYGASFGDYDRDGWLDLYVANRYLVGSQTISNPNFLFRNTGNGYFGGLQFTLVSWEGVGGFGSPANASREEQIMRAEMLYDLQGWGAWPRCSAQLGLG